MNLGNLIQNISNYESGQLSEMAEGGSAFLAIFLIYAKEMAFTPEDSFNQSPEMREMRRNVVMQELILHGTPCHKEGSSSRNWRI